MKSLKYAVFMTSIAVSSSIHANLNDGLIAYYPFNGDANDATGYGYHGTVYGATETMDRFGNFSAAYYFDGIEDFIQIPNNPLLNPAHLSLSVWVNVALDVNHNLSMDIISKDGERHSRQFLLNENGSGSFRAHIGTAVGDFHYFDSTPYERGEWHHLVQTYDGVSLNLYVDGQPEFPEETRTTSGGVDNSLQPIRIGGGAPKRSYPLWFRGLIDDVRIYNRALSELEVLELFKQESPTELYRVEIEETIYNQGFEAGVAQCQNDPAACGITTVSESSESDDSEDSLFNLSVESDNCLANATFSEESGILSIPVLESVSIFNGTARYRVEMSLIQGEESLFSISHSEEIVPSTVLLKATNDE